MVSSLQYRTLINCIVLVSSSHKTTRLDQRNEWLNDVKNPDYILDTKKKQKKPKLAEVTFSLYFHWFLKFVFVARSTKKNAYYLGKVQAIFWI